MKLFIAAFSLHLILLYVCTRFDIYRHNPPFLAWLLVGVAVNIALAVLGWTRTFAAFDRLSRIYELAWYALMAGIIAWAVTHYSSASAPAILKGTIALVILTAIGRLVTGAGMVGHASGRLENAINLAYLVPTIYLILALSPIRIDRIPASIVQFSKQQISFQGALIHATSERSSARLPKV